MSIFNRSLTENVEESVNECDVLGRTALHIAVMYELPNETKVLLQHGADINLKDKLMELTPVEYAGRMCTLSAEVFDGSLLGTISMENKLVIAQIMDARPETITLWASKKKPDMCHESYLYIAAKHGLVNLLTHFVERRTNINSKVHGGHRLLLHELSYFGQVETMKVVLKLGAFCHIKDGYDNTALHIAVVRNHKDVINLLLDSKLDVNSKNISGCTALHLAVILCNYDIAELLVSYGADINAIDDNDYTPLSIAHSYQDFKMIQLLHNTNSG
ncbi:hypothetical protein L9F63_011898 [Diploptera punctata]|uniref:Uncharacterized protein n=1 Tax=Diploptera punctata TaxID=6984 RepID=A0AAD8EPF6_DIPPU|nr:hypothetical protein L9F63_011898 [Diploptera punctata]